jgi:hypothetical protein
MVIMKIGGWRTRGVFERYAIVSRDDIVDAMRKLQINQQEFLSHEIGHVSPTDQNDPPPRSIDKALESIFCWCPEGDLNPHEVALCGF